MIREIYKPVRALVKGSLHVFRPARGEWEEHSDNPTPPPVKEVKPEKKVEPVPEHKLPPRTHERTAARPAPTNSDRTNTKEEKHFLRQVAAVGLMLTATGLAATLFESSDPDNDQGDLPIKPLVQAQYARAGEPQSNTLGNVTIEQPMLDVTRAAESGITVHVVQSGDTLSALALYYGVELSRFIEANSITDPDALYIGQTLIVPERSSATSTTIATTSP